MPDAGEMYIPTAQYSPISCAGTEFDCNFFEA
jgi:hypothetical protein